jgi:transposase-like protein
MAVMALPEKYRRRLKSTNMQERLNEEVRRRERVIRIFPSEASAMRIIGTLLEEKNRNGPLSFRIHAAFIDDRSRRLRISANGAAALQTRSRFMPKRVIVPRH